MGALRDVAARLRKALTQAELARQLAYHSRPARALPGGARGLPPAGNTKRLVAYHQSQHESARQAKLDKANAAVRHIHQWLHRQGAFITGEGELQWPRSQARIVYDRELERQGATKISFRGGQLFTAAGRPLDTSRMVTQWSGPGWAIYVVSAEGHLHVCAHSVGHRHHSSLLAGAPVACAGELQCANGRLTRISNKSGHYKPRLMHLLQVLALLDLHCVPPSYQITRHLDGSHFQTTTCGDFLLQVGLDQRSIESVKVGLLWLELLDRFQPEELAEDMRIECRVEVVRPGIELARIYDISGPTKQLMTLAEVDQRMAAAGWRAPPARAPRSAA